MTPITNDEVPVDPTEPMRARMVAAFARAASTIAWEGSLQEVLDDLAAEVLSASRATSCAMILVCQTENSVQMYGSAGYPDGYVDRLNDVLAARAPLISLEAYRSRVEIIRGIRNIVDRDPRFAALGDLIREADWTTLVSIPLMVRNDRVGVLTAIYSATTEPDDVEIAFLEAMADHGAIAIHTARLLAEAEEKAALEERNRMARDIHDVVAQSLFSIRLRTKALQIIANRSDPEGALLSGLATLESTADRAVEDMRALVLHLQPSDLRGADLVDAIRRYAEIISDGDAPAVKVRSVDALPVLAGEIEVQIYHIAREAIANCVDHARASRLSVEVGPMWRNGTEFLYLEISDDGRGFDLDTVPQGHMGVQNMRSRAAEIGAEIAITSSAAGTEVRVELPLARTGPVPAE